MNIHLSAGTPIQGATVSVYAVNDGDGRVNTLVGNAGVIGIGGPTDAAGNASVALSMPNYSGPIQVTASGASLSFVDPSLAAVASSSGTTIQIPSSFIFSSYASLAPGSSISLPVDLLTTIADQEALAYARGLHPAHPGAKALTRALADRDALFVRHIVSSSSSWDPATLRTTIPAALTAGPQTLNDSAFAAFFDLGLSSLARATAAQAGFPPNSTTFNAVTLAALLMEDVKADGVFDGRGEKGVQLTIGDQSQLALNGQYLRIPLAQALDQWVQSKSGNASSIRQGDLVATGVYTSMSGDRSDLFADAPQGLYNPTDLVPPEVSFVTEPPAYVIPGTTSVVLTINASDPSGVANVWCASGSPLKPILATAVSSSTWACTIGLPPVGATPIAVWAVDLANPSNSGADSVDQRYHLARAVTVDGSPPTANIVETVLAFRNEDGLSVKTDVAGHALVPPQYTYTQGLTNIHNGTTINKVSTRAAWATAPTTAQLEGSNPDNIPFVQYVVPFNALTDAPITTARWTINLSGSILGSATGDLWPSGSNSFALLYDLPLAANLIPALGSLTGPATLTATITLGDAAGNTQSVPGGTFTFQLLGPPLAISEDTTYPATADPRSAFPYRIADPLYAQLFQTGAPAFLPEDAVRLVRYLVTNPASSAVALTLPTIPAAWSASETWTGFEAATGLTGTGCGDPAPANGPGNSVPTVASGGLISFAYNQNLGLDGSPAQKTTTGQVLVPPASGSTPGTIALYLARSLSPLVRSVPLTWNGSKFETALGIFWDFRATGASVCCERNFEVFPHPCITFGFNLVETQYSYFRDLSAASEALAGSFQLVTLGVAGTTVLGQPSTSPTTVAITRTILH